MQSAKTVLHTEREMALHLGYCEDFGLSKEAVERQEESQGLASVMLEGQSVADNVIACTAYTRYILDIGQSEDWLALQVSFAPCLIGYGVIARRLFNDPKTVRKGNTYWKWIEKYTNKDYTSAVEAGSGKLDSTV